jgi:hypothetical protein
LKYTICEILWERPAKSLEPQRMQRKGRKERKEKQKRMIFSAFSAVNRFSSVQISHGEAFHGMQP